MNHAAPAPRTCAASAAAAIPSEETVVKSAIPSNPPDVEPAPLVGPAVLIDVPTKHVPEEKIKEGYSHLSPVSVNTLRGTTGSDFESRAAVIRGAAKKNFLQKVLPFFFDERDFVSYGEVQRFILVKGGHCFVFSEETDISPLYAFPLSGLTANIEDPENPEHLSVTISPSFQNIRKGDLSTVLLKNLNGKIVYQITFDIKEDRKIADRFFSLVQQTVEEGKDPAGKTSSVAYANAVALSKEK